MKKEMAGEGKDVNVLAVNIIAAEASQPDLATVCSFPLFQDVEAVNAWSLHGGGKDDLYVYDSTGHLARYLKIGGEVSTNLADPDAYANVKGIVAATK